MLRLNRGNSDPPTLHASPTLPVDWSKFPIAAVVLAKETTKVNIILLPKRSYPDNFRAKLEGAKQHHCSSKRTLLNEDVGKRKTEGGGEGEREKRKDKRGKKKTSLSGYVASKLRIISLNTLDIQLDQVPATALRVGVFLTSNQSQPRPATS